jgi:hypothetical protein
MENLYYCLKMDRDPESRNAFLERQKNLVRSFSSDLTPFTIDEWTFLRSANLPNESRFIDEKVRQLIKLGHTCHFRVVAAASVPAIANGNFRRIRDSIIFDEEISLLSFDEPNKEELKHSLKQEVQKHSDAILKLQQKKTELNRDEIDSARELAAARKKLNELG